MQALKSKIITAVLIAISLSLDCAFACTGIGLHYKNQYFVGKNHDWASKYADIIINPRGMVNHATQFMRKDGGNSSLPGEFDSLPRFAKAAYALKVMPQIESKQQAVSYMFNAL